MERNAEIALAKSAAPESISRGAEVMVLAPHGDETVVKGKNAFVCMVERSWTAGIDDPDFWNPKLRAPICFNPPAARHCAISADGERLLENVVSRLGLSARAYERILKVSRTIADLNGVESIDPNHLSQAIHYRTLDRSYWA
jgi:hypothetical protein